jgi:hypothetical protein
MTAFEVDAAHCFVAAEAAFFMAALVEDGFFFVVAHWADEADFGVAA